MKYYTKKDDTIYKYEIAFDNEKLENLKQEIINNYCFNTYKKKCETPYLIKLIDELQNNNSNVLKDVITPNYSDEEIKEDEEFLLLNNKIEQLKQKINNINNNKIDQKIEMLVELKELLKQQNNKKTPIGVYYLKLRQLIKFIRIDDNITDVLKKKV